MPEPAPCRGGTPSTSGMMGGRCSLSSSSGKTLVAWGASQRVRAVAATTSPVTTTIAAAVSSAVNLPLATVGAPPAAAEPPSGGARATMTMMRQNDAVPWSRRKPNPTRSCSCQGGGGLRLIAEASEPGLRNSDPQEAASFVCFSFPALSTKKGPTGRVLNCGACAFI